MATGYEPNIEGAIAVLRDLMIANSFTMTRQPYEPNYRGLVDAVIDLKEGFPTAQDITDFIFEAEKRIKGFHRFYSAEKKIKGNLITCKVKFFDQGNLEYGTFEETVSQVDAPVIKNFAQRIALAKKELKIASKPNKNEQKKKELEGT